MIASVKKSIDIPLIVGGGIRDGKTAREKAKAGADIIITGTALENKNGLKKTLTEIISSIEDL